MGGSVRTRITLCLCLFECLLFGGTIYGWPSLIYIYKDRGILSQLCNSTLNISENHDDPSQTGCPRQDSLLSLAFTVGVAVFGLSCLPTGVIFDKLGLRFVRTIAIVTGAAGSLFLAFVSQGDLSYLIFPGAVCLGISCPLMIMTNSHVAGLAGPRTALFINLFCGVVNSSGIVFYFVKLAYDKGFDYKWSLIVVACLWVLVVLTTYILLPNKKVSQGEFPDATVPTQENEPDRPVVASPRFPVFTCAYLSHVVYYSTLNMCVTLVIGTMNTWLSQVTNNNQSKVSALTNTYAYIQFGIGILVPPFAGALTHQAGKTVSRGHAIMAAPGLLVASLCTCLAYTFLLVATSWSPYFVFVFNEVCRAFFYGNATVYITQMFPVEVFGLLFGLMYAVSGVGLSVQYGYIQWSLTSGYTQVSILLLVTAVLSLAHPAWMFYNHVRDQRPPTVDEVDGNRRRSDNAILLPGERA